MTQNRGSSSPSVSSSGPGAPEASVTIPVNLTKQCLALNHPNQRYTNEALALTSELLRLFVLEARRRAAIEAECEAIADTHNLQEKENINIESRFITNDVNGNKHGSPFDCDMQISDEESHRNIHYLNRAKRKAVVVDIRADHIAKIAAELLMDLS